MSAVEYARSHDNRYICNISCFSCGPDAIIHHRLRRELEGLPFCFLEIDSHTAHAGIETRIGAFLDIIEASRGAGFYPYRRPRERVATGPSGTGRRAHLGRDGQRTAAGAG